MDWMPYPSKMPEKDGEYLVTTGLFVDIAFFRKFLKQYDSEGMKYHGPGWEDLRAGGIHDNIKAFMKKPEPYEGG
jgi:hypothetical protein